MKTAKQIFNRYLNEKVGNQISIVDEICEKTGLDTQKWFTFFIDELDMYSGDDFLNSILDNFSVYLTNEFEKKLVKYIKPTGYSINNTPYYDIFISVADITEDENDIKFELVVDEEYIETFSKVIKKLTLTQKEELLKNKLFLYIINQTNLDFLSNNDIRALKLRFLNECV